MTDVLKAPFPWFGGKSRAASLIWPRFGDVANYVEPFAGSLAVLLARPHVPRIETVNDLDCYLANFWRAVAADPEQVARFADGPVNEADLHARHRWLVDRAEFRERMRSEPDHFDARVAGWWVYGLSAWIGSGWCAKTEGVPSRQLPRLAGNAAGIHGQGARDNVLRNIVSLGVRLRNTHVACGGFGRVLTPAILQNHGPVGVLLDPPYADGEEVYAEGGNSTFADVATWATEHGNDERLRIALCGYAGTWEPPQGWTTVEWKAAGGYAVDDANSKRERLWFSKGCLTPDRATPQGSLFDLFSTVER